MGKRTIHYNKGTARRVFQHILSGALLCLSAVIIPFSIISCASDIEENDYQGAGSQATLTFTVSTRGTAEDGYEDGNSVENKISSHKIYFFDSSNQYIATFEEDSFTSSGDGTEYTVSGKLEEDLVNTLSSGNFKIVFIANWSSYPEETDFTGTTTTIESLCEGEVGSVDAQFTCPKLTSADDLSNVSIPFYGVHSYENVSFAKGKTTTLEAVTLLRAMAKVELIDAGIATRNYYYATIKAAKICHYNAKGYCAPLNVYSQEDYGQGAEGDNNYVSTLHLTGTDNSNDDQTNNPTLDMYQCNDSTWVAYIPEYDNSKEDTCYIELTLECADEDEDYDHTDKLPTTVYSIYFSEDGTSEGSLYNIQRNNLYRFRVDLPKIWILSEDNASGWGWFSKKK
ncbi:MAG: fimbrial protein [Prevotella sp.]|nr:fimbrial protein [Prevotella sp.]